MNKWEEKLNRAKKLRTDGAKALHERVRLLCECYDDQRFAEWCEENDTAQLDYLDGFVSDLAVDFATVRAVYVRNPDAASWVQHGFRYLLAEMLRDQPKKDPRTVPSYKQLYEEAKRRIEILEAQIEALQTSLRR